MFNKNTIIGFILGIIICGLAGVYAATITSSNVSYGSTSVESALNDLYVIANTRFYNVEIIYDFFNVNTDQDLSIKKDYYATKSGKIIISMNFFTGLADVDSKISYSVNKNGLLVNSTYKNTDSWNRTINYIFDVNKNDYISFYANAIKSGTAVSLGVFAAYLY